MKENGKMMNLMEKENWLLKINGYMRVILWRVKRMVKEMYYLCNLGTNLKENLRIILKMVMEKCIG